MTDHDMPDDRLTEHDLTEVAPDVQRALAAMVRGVEAGPELRARVERGVRSGPSRLGALPMRRALAAAAAAAILIGGVAVLGGWRDDPDAVVTVADDPEGGESTDTPPPTVGGVTITRPEADAATTSTTAQDPTTTVPAAAGGTLGTTPVTAALLCRDSFDPACGDFRWDPEPLVGQSTLQMRLPAGAPKVGEPYDVVVELTDPTAQPSFNCADSAVDPLPATWVGVSGCVIENPETACAERYGPWTPPAPEGGTVTMTVTLTFEQPGPHTFSVSTRTPYGGCYQPYGSDAYGSVTVEVLP